MTEEKQFLTTREAGERLGIGIQWVLDLIHAGRLRAKKFGHVWMVDAESVAKFKRLKPGPKPKSDKSVNSP